LLLIGYSIWDLDQLSGPGASVHYSLAAARVAPTGPVLVGAAARPDAAMMAAAAIVPAGSAMAAEPAAARPGGTSVMASRADQGLLAPWVAVGCRVAMGATMAFMLLIMI